ncbi:MAG: hypothetical protein IJU04_02750 [Ruminococcus sp.]|nr:hypothetical protein [Ruminococcus sp.]
MFGYIRAFKPYMRMCEYDTYNAVYCGLCKEIGRKYGFVPRFSLSFDFTFLALMDMSLNKTDLCAKKQRCIAHPLKKRFCVCCSNGLEYSASSAMLLVYHKLKDDLQDKSIKSKLRSVLLLPFFKCPYKKARANYAELAKSIEEQMASQRAIEQEKCASIDKACEPTALIMQEIFGALGNAGNKQNLMRFGYLLGRFIYICDAFDDIRDDCKKGNYNPLLLIFDSDDNNKVIDDERFAKIKDYVSDSINFTLGELAESYVKLEVENYKPIIDNIIYLGLKNVSDMVLKEKFKRKLREVKDDERSV